MLLDVLISFEFLVALWGSVSVLVDFGVVGLCLICLSVLRIWVVALVFGFGFAFLFRGRYLVCIWHLLILVTFDCGFGCDDWLVLCGCVGCCICW